MARSIHDLVRGPVLSTCTPLGVKISPQSRESQGQTGADLMAVAEFYSTVPTHICETVSRVLYYVVAYSAAAGSGNQIQALLRLSQKWDPQSNKLKVDCTVIACTRKWQTRMASLRQSNIERGRLLVHLLRIKVWIKLLS